MLLILARHGNTFGPDDTPVWVGANEDLPLVEKGLEQSRAMGEALRTLNQLPDRIIAGPLKRTRTGARLVGEICGLRFVVDLSHFDFNVDVRDQALEFDPSFTDEARCIVPSLFEKSGEDGPAIRQVADRFVPSIGDVLQADNQPASDRERQCSPRTLELFDSASPLQIEISPKHSRCRRDVASRQRVRDGTECSECVFLQNLEDRSQILDCFTSDPARIEEVSTERGHGDENQSDR